MKNPFVDDILNENGERVKVQKIGEKIEAFVSLNPLSFSTFSKGEKSNIEESRKYSFNCIDKKII